MDKNPPGAWRSLRDGAAVIAALRLRVFGSLQVEGIDFSALGSRKQRTLLRMLALGRGDPVAVDRLAEGLWPERLPARPTDQVGVLVSRLRAVLGRERVTRSDAGYALVADWIDLVAFEQLAEEARRRLSEDQPAAACTAAQAGLALAAHPLLADDRTQRGRTRPGERSIARWRRCNPCRPKRRWPSAIRSVPHLPLRPSSIRTPTTSTPSAC